LQFTAFGTHLFKQTAGIVCHNRVYSYILFVLVACRFMSVLHAHVIIIIIIII